MQIQEAGERSDMYSPYIRNKRSLKRSELPSEFSLLNSQPKIAGIPNARSLASARFWAGVGTLLLLLATVCSTTAKAQQVETALPASPRVTINLAAGMPGQSQWLYIKDSDSAEYATPSYSDSAWTPVGIPYSANLLTSFLNATSGGGDGDLNGTNNWYRLHFKLDTQYANSKILVEFEGAHTGAQVYINGTLLPGISAVAANAQASHVVGFIPFIVDLTPYVKADGVTDNVLAVSVSRGNTWFEQPGFSQDYRFGQADAGLFRPAYMFITNKVHIPVNVYSNQKTWGTYVATLSEVPSATSTAQATSAAVEVQTNVLNETATSEQVTVTTQIVDAKGNVVAVAPPITQTVAPTTSATLPSGATPMFDQKITVTNPTLWYPNNSTFGTPYMYKVYHVVSVNGEVVDAAQSPLGIRTITWDQNFPYFNGHPMFLWGASGRYDYPALGSSVPEEQQWRDLAQFAAEGGNIWRPGHSSTSEEFVNAADAYGIMIDQPSGDGEGAFSAPTADMVTLKEELHRDMIIRDRSHPSILDWESNNGTMNETVGAALLAIDQIWDPINTRVAADRTPDPKNGDMLGCTLEGCEVGVKNEFPNNPAWGAEYWGNGTARGLDWDYELAFAAPFLDNWRKSREANAFGMAQWYFADSPGEDGLYAEYQQYLGTSQAQTYINSVRGLGASSVDMNRFPKLLYYVYQAAWTPFTIKPVVHLAHHWNRSGVVQENVFSNCPSVRLLINGVQQGSDQVPNSWNSDSSGNLTQATTKMPFQASWPVTWVAGTVEAECLDQFGNVVAIDSRVTAGAESKIVLSVVPDIVKPDGTSFAVSANGSDAAFVTASVVDANGNVVPTAADALTFSVSGPATYMGGTEQLVSTATDAYSVAHGELSYHAPGDPQLQVEGGMTKIALRSQFTPGTVTVTATAPGLGSGTATYTIQPVPSVIPAPSAPAILVAPTSTAVTVGKSGVFAVTASGTASLSFQWLKNGAAIAGATASSYSTPATTSADNGSTFTVTVTNSEGSATSTAATLTVDAAADVVITTQPASQTAYVGQTAQLSVAATGSPSLTYQWLKSGAAIAGATTSTYTTPVLTAADNGDTFSVIVSNPVDTVTSTVATLVVDAAIAPAITQQPASVSVLANNPATFSVGVSGSSPFTYQWQFNGVNLLGANSATYSIAAVQSTNAGSYRVIVTNAAGSVTSAAASLTIAPPGINLALNRPATASSSQSGGLTPNFVTDGNLSTRWSSAPGVDPSWIDIDLGSVQKFDNVILYWENAYATVYQIQYSTDNATWEVAYTNNDGVGGIENLTFPTVEGRYVRLYGEQRATVYGYSLWEIQVYNIAQCGGAGERYTVLSSTAVHDNISDLTWQRAETTFAGGGSQYTQPIAQNYCSSKNLRLPTQSEALAISGPSAASCAFPQPWNTWTSTPDPANSNDAGFVTSTGLQSYQVADNYPGAVLCTSGTSVAPPSIATQPASESVDLGAAATFSVVAGGTDPFTYQWFKNGTAITAAVAATYTTPATVSTDSGALFSVVVTGPTNETVTSNTATLTLIPPPADIVAISAGGTGSGAFVADEDFTGGGVGATANTISTVGVLFPAPESVYQTERNGTFTYTIPGLVAGATYPVRLHFDEFYFTAVGQRIFNVSINGAPVLTNFDIVAAAGGPNQAVVEQFNAVANGSGEIVISFIGGSANQPKVDGIEIRDAVVSNCSALPPAPTGVTATGTSSTTIGLAWTAVAPPTGCTTITYNVYRSTTSGFTSSTSTLIASGLTGTSYVSTGLTASITYYYLVLAVDSSGSSAASTQVGAKTQASGSEIVAIHSGGGAVSNANGGDTSFVADEDFTGGGADVSTHTIATAGVANAAPEAVYQTERAGQFTYTISSLVPGNSYTVLLHFAEFYWTAEGKRVFNVVINGSPVLSDFDIFAKAGANKALVEQFTAIANGSGQIVIAYTNGTADQPKSSGIEIRSSGTALPSPPVITSQPAAQTVALGKTATFSVTATGTAPIAYQWEGNGAAISGATAASYTTPATTAANNGEQFTVKVTNSGGSVTSNAAVLTVTNICNAVPAVPGSIAATATSSSQISLTWAASTASCVVTYNVFRSTVSGFVASSSNQVATGLAGTSFVDAGLTTSTAYYYRVSASDATGSSAASAQATATTQKSTPPNIATQPASQTVAIGTTATFTVVASGNGPFTYQWRKNGSFIPGATSASYNTPTTSAPDSGAIFTVVVTNASGAATSANAVLTVNNSPAYTVYPGFIGTDLNNNTHGAWADNQIYIEILGSNVTTNALSWVNYNGVVTASSLADNTAANAITGPDGKTYPNYAFTLAQSNHLLKLPPLNGGRIYVSFGSPMYIPITAGTPLGYAGPNPLNATDPNTNTHYDWYEFDWGGASNALFINTTQVDMFGLPLTLDVWGSKETFHQQTGITESISVLDEEFAAEVPEAFQTGQSPISPLRIWAPAHVSFASGGVNADYLQSYINSVWAQYSSTPLTVLLDNNSRKFTGTTSGTAFTFTEVNLNNGAYGGAGTYTVNQPSTQDILLCDGTMATGSGVTAALEAQFCAAFNRHVMDNSANWAIASDYYLTAPANYYSAFWHNHSIAGLSYGFAYDDVDSQSSSIVSSTPEHMAFGISW